MLKIFFVTMLSCTTPDCHEVAHVIHPVPVTREHCSNVARDVFNASTLVQAIGCKEQGKADVAYEFIRYPGRIPE